MCICVCFVCVRGSLFVFVYDQFIEVFIFVHMSIFFMCSCLGVCVYYASLCELVYVCMIFFGLFLFCIYACLFVHGRMSVCV